MRPSTRSSPTTPRVLPSLPRLGAALPPAPVERAGGAHPLRQGAHRQRCLGAPVLGAHLGDRRRRRREHGEPRRGPQPSAVARPRRPPLVRGGGHRRARSRVADARVRVQHAARRQVDRRPPAPLRQTGWRAGTSSNEASDESGPRRSSRPWCRRATTSRSGEYALKAQLLGIDRMSRTTSRMASVTPPPTRRFGWTEPRGTSCSTPARRSPRSFRTSYARNGSSTKAVDRRRRCGRASVPETRSAPPTPSRRASTRTCS